MSFQIQLVHTFVVANMLVVHANYLIKLDKLVDYRV